MQSLRVLVFHHGKCTYDSPYDPKCIPRKGIMYTPGQGKWERICPINTQFRLKHIGIVQVPKYMQMMILLLV